MSCWKKTKHKTMDKNSTKQFWRTVHCKDFKSIFTENSKWRLKFSVALNEGWSLRLTSKSTEVCSVCGSSYLECKRQIHGYLRGQDKPFLDGIQKVWNRKDLHVWHIDCSMNPLIQLWIVVLELPRLLILDSRTTVLLNPINPFKNIDKN